MPAASIRPLHPAPRPLSELAAAFGLDDDDLDLERVEATGVSISSRDIDAGDLYVAMPGAVRHGAEFAVEALEQGAVAILTDERGRQLALEAGVDAPILVVEQPRLALGDIAAWVYRTDADEPRLYGITGTNGKTSCAYILDAILGQLGVVTGLTTTVERRIGDVSLEAALTTPEASELHALIARMREVGVHAASIEVSAQAITRHRVDGILFDVVGFINLSHDHLDDYDTFDDYFQAKLELFTPERARRGVVSLDSEWGDRVVEESRIPLATISSRPGVAADWTVEVTGSTGAATAFTLTAPDGRSLSTSIPLPGWFSAANAGLAIAMLVESGYDLGEIDHVLERDGRIDAFVPGRTELISGDEGPRFYLDYGHTPDAFAQTLGALREFTDGRLIMIFGADGERDATKRPDMGRIAAELADVVFITDYNPRREDPAAIRATLLEAARAAGPERDVREVPDVRRAMRDAVAMAGPGDTILLAGPGHETASHVGGEKIAFSARDEARHVLREAGWEL